MPVIKSNQIIEKENCVLYSSIVQYSSIVSYTFGGVRSSIQWYEKNFFFFFFRILSMRVELPLFIEEKLTTISNGS